MSISLVNMDWGNHIPNLDGEFDGNDFSNLKDIVTIVDYLDNDSLKLLERKCWRFINQLDSADTIKMGNILSRVFDNKPFKVVFSNGNEGDIAKFLFSALKKDFPSLKVSDLSKINYEEFAGFINVLYGGKELDDTDKKEFLSVLDKLNIDDPANRFKISNEISLHNLSSSQLLKFLKVYEDKISKNEIKEDENVTRELLEKIDALNVQDRKDVKVIIELIKHFGSKQSKLAKFVSHNAANISLVKAANNAEPQSFLKRLLEHLFTRLHHSFLYWFKVDPKFIIEQLKTIPASDPKINISILRRGLSDEFIAELQKLDNINLFFF